MELYRQLGRALRDKQLPPGCFSHVPHGFIHSADLAIYIGDRLYFQLTRHPNLEVIKEIKRTLEYWTDQPVRIGYFTQWFKFVSLEAVATHDYFIPQDIINQLPLDPATAAELALTTKQTLSKFKQESKSTIRPTGSIRITSNDQVNELQKLSTRYLNYEVVFESNVDVAKYTHLFKLFRFNLEWSQKRRFESELAKLPFRLNNQTLLYIHQKMDLWVRERPFTDLEISSYSTLPLTVYSGEKTIRNPFNYLMMSPYQIAREQQPFNLVMPDDFENPVGISRAIRVYQVSENRIPQYDLVFDTDSEYTKKEKKRNEKAVINYAFALATGAELRVPSPGTFYASNVYERQYDPYTRQGLQIRHSWRKDRQIYFKFDYKAKYNFDIYNWGPAKLAFATGEQITVEPNHEYTITAYATVSEQVSYGSRLWIGVVTAKVYTVMEVVYVLPINFVKYVEGDNYPELFCLNRAQFGIPVAVVDILGKIPMTEEDAKSAIAIHTNRETPIIKLI